MVLGLKLFCNVRLPFEEVKLLSQYSVVAAVSMSGATADIMFASQVRAWTSHEHQLSSQSRSSKGTMISRKRSDK